MFLNTDVDERISRWREFRNTLEDHADPFRATLDFWNQAPTTHKDLEQFHPQAWPTPWELIAKNRYCPVAIPLMIGWTLKLTTRFSETPVLIKISIDHTTQRYYNLVNVKDYVINTIDNCVARSGELSSNIVCQDVVEILQQ